MPVNLRVLFNYEAIRSFGDNAIYRRGKQQEIIDVYINKQDKLHKNKWDFVWITNKCNWYQGQNRVKKFLVYGYYVAYIKNFQ